MLESLRVSGTVFVNKAAGYNTWEEEPHSLLWTLHDYICTQQKNMFDVQLVPDILNLVPLMSVS